jgi:hypothetical protein
MIPHLQEFLSLVSGGEDISTRGQKDLQLKRMKQPAIATLIQVKVGVPMGSWGSPTTVPLPPTAATRYERVMVNQ